MASNLAKATTKWVDSAVASGVDRLADVVGGPARLRVILLLAAVLGLDSADQGSIGAVAPYLESSLHISNLELGLLVTVTSLVGAVATIPMGNLVDRSKRVRLVVLAILLWAAAEAVSAVSVDYVMLVISRVALGAVTAIAAPAIASLTGDLFPANERGRIYGFIITGELIGAGFGVLVAGLVAGWFGWRPAIGLLAVPSFALAYLLRRHLPEPARGGHSWIVEDADRIPATREAPLETSTAFDDGEVDAAPSGSEASATLMEGVERQGVEPDEAIVVEEDPSDWSLWEAIRYVVRVRTNLVMIVASSLGYFFFAGLKTFVVLFVRGQYGLSQGATITLVLVIGAGAVLGVIFGGRFADRQIGKGRIRARVTVGMVGYTAAAVLLAPAIWTTDLVIAIPLIIVGAAAISAPNATLDAARLDVVPAKLWGRAEAVRTLLRTVLEAFAPLVFGIISEVFGSNKAGFGVVGGGLRSSAGSPSQVHGLEIAFLLMLIPLAVSGIMLFWARKTYPTDVASAGASQRAMQERV